MSSESQIAAQILTKAITLDNKKRYTESLICYEQGLQILMGVMKNMANDEEKANLRTRISDYMGRAEKIKQIVETEKEKNSYHEQIIIENDSSGHCYETVFGRFFDTSINKIEIDDAYIRMFHQCQNLVRFCELAVKKCANLRTIILTTVAHSAEQNQWLQQIQSEVTRYRIDLKINYSSTLHDREIRLDNGWIIKIGRGLDYFKKADSGFSIGTFDMDLRKCHETTIDIFHNKGMIRRNG